MFISCHTHQTPEEQDGFLFGLTANSLWNKNRPRVIFCIKSFSVKHIFLPLVSHWVEMFLMNAMVANFPGNECEASVTVRHRAHVQEALSCLPIPILLSELKQTKSEIMMEHDLQAWNFSSFVLLTPSTSPKTGSWPPASLSTVTLFQASPSLPPQLPLPPNHCQLQCRSLGRDPHPPFLLGPWAQVWEQLGVKKSDTLSYPWLLTGKGPLATLIQAQTVAHSRSCNSSGDMWCVYPKWGQ
jgi:hypothetical protein